MRRILLLTWLVCGMGCMEETQAQGWAVVGGKSAEGRSGGRMDFVVLDSLLLMRLRWADGRKDTEYYLMDTYLSLEAMRVVGKMPDWQPAVKGGKPVRCLFVLPVNFTLDRRTRK